MINISAASNSYFRRQKTLKALLRAHFGECTFSKRILKGSEATNYVLVWGNKASGRRARIRAERNGIGVLRCEDGFIRSIKPGDSFPIGLAIDDRGIYYDCKRESKLETLIKKQLRENQSERSRALIDLIKKKDVSKYNDQRSWDGEKQDFVLVVDQTLGDLSIECGGANKKTFEIMMQTAIKERNGRPIIIKVHPDVAAGKKQGCIDLKKWEQHESVTVEASGCHPGKLIKHARTIYVVTSQLGFEGLIHGKQVETFGCPFYAGWGLTRDHGEIPERRKRKAGVTLEALVHAALIEYCTYICPKTEKRIEVEEVVERIGFHRSQCENDPKSAVAIGFHRWKRGVLRDFMPMTKIRFKDIKGFRLGDGEELVAWGKGPEERQNEILHWVEDGFIRSIGLGADLKRPLSWAVDNTGVHYSHQDCSQLRTALEQLDVSEEERQRARRLLTSLIDLRLSKYNVKGSEWKPPATKGRVVAVIGQVEGDQSITYGNAEIETNRCLLQKAREAEKDAYIVYKPHPDVEAGLRTQRSTDEDLRLIADEVASNVDILGLLDNVDAVHVNTSLTGLEAIARNVEVNVWGWPFYAGLGLTRDHSEIVVRKRDRSVEELIYISMIWYPRYLCDKSKWLISAEEAVERLTEMRNRSKIRFDTRRMLVRTFVRIRNRLSVTAM